MTACVAAGAVGRWKRAWRTPRRRVARGHGRTIANAVGRRIGRIGGIAPRLARRQRGWRSWRSRRSRRSVGGIVRRHVAARRLRSCCACRVRRLEQPAAARATRVSDSLDVEAAIRTRHGVTSIKSAIDSAWKHLEELGSPCRDTAAVQRTPASCPAPSIVEVTSDMGRRSPSNQGAGGPRLAVASSRWMPDVHPIGTVPGHVP